MCESFRPQSIAVLNHPFFWGEEKKLSFLCDVSQRMKIEDRKANSSLLQALERTGTKNFGGVTWNVKMNRTLLQDIFVYRTYGFASVRDYLRVIRNKRSHYEESSPNIQVFI